MATPEQLEIYRDIQEEGEAVLLRRVVVSNPGGLDPVESKENHATFGLFAAFKAHLVDGERIQASDVKIFVPEYLIPSPPVPGDRVVRTSSNKVFSVLYVETISEQGSPLLHEIHARGKA